MNTTDASTTSSLDDPTTAHAFKPHAALLLVQIMFGTWPIIGKIALRSIPSTGVVFFRIVGAAIAFWILRRVTTKTVISDKSHFLQFALFSLLGVVLNQFLFLKGLELSTVINATLLGTAIPIWTLIVSILLRREKATLGKGVGVLLAVAGVIYLIDPARADFSPRTALGDILLVANTAVYGAYIAISQNMIKRYGALTVISWIFLFACIPAVPIGGFHLAQVSLVTVPLSGWLAIIYIILVPTVGAYYLNAWALARVAPSVVAAYIYLQPLIGFALAPYVLGEEWNSRMWVAAALVFIGVGVVLWRRTAPETKDAIVAEYHTTGGS